jgi:hypothetical protein
VICAAALTVLDDQLVGAYGDVSVAFASARSGDDSDDDDRGGDMARDVTISAMAATAAGVCFG